MIVGCNIQSRIELEDSRTKTKNNFNWSFTDNNVYKL